MAGTQLAFLSVLASFLLGSCAGVGPAPLPAPFVHVVFFTMKPGAGDSVAEITKDVHEMLAPLPSVRGISVGPRALGTEDRPVVDTKYDVGLLVLFDDRKGLQEYLDHPTHLEFAKKHDTLCDVRVFDFAR